MQDYKAYALALENIIMDQLLPMYLVGCRASGKQPAQNAILTALLTAKRESSREVCALLRSVDLDYGVKTTQAS